MTYQMPQGVEHANRLFTHGPQMHHGLSNPRALECWFSACDFGDAGPWREGDSWTRPPIT